MKGLDCVGSFRCTFGERKNVPTLLHLAKRGKFDVIIRLLQGDDHRFYLDECADSANHHGTLNMFLGRSTLQLMMVYRPPVELVDLLIRRCHEHNPNHYPEDSIDMQGRTPLHVAVEYGCSIETCQRLMGDNLPVIMKDLLDRTPLHYACASVKKYTSKRCKQNAKLYPNVSSTSEKAQNCYKVVCALVTAYPEATIITDVNGKTPIQLARENQADKRIIDVLTMTSDRVRQTSCDSVDPTKQLLESSIFTINSDSFSSDIDLSSVGSCGVSKIRI
jgi:mannose/fructose-specific phosphotransferase system component IIA